MMNMSNRMKDFLWDLTGMSGSGMSVGITFADTEMGIKLLGGLGGLVLIGLSIYHKIIVIREKRKKTTNKND